MQLQQAVTIDLYNCGICKYRFTITANPDFIGSIDNVSVKEVGQDWSLGTGWSIGDDKVEADGTSAFLNKLIFKVLLL